MNKFFKSSLNVLFALATIGGWHYDIIYLRLPVQAYIMFMAVISVPFLISILRFGSRVFIKIWDEVSVEQGIETMAFEDFNSDTEQAFDYFGYDLIYSIMLAYIGGPVWAILYFGSMSVFHHMNYTKRHMPGIKKPQ